MGGFESDQDSATGRVCIRDRWIGINFQNFQMSTLKAMKATAESLRLCIQELHIAMGHVHQSGDKGYAVDERKRKLGVMMDEAIDAATVEMKRIANEGEEAPLES